MLILLGKNIISSTIIFLNAELNPICHFLALLGSHHTFHVGRLRFNALAHCWGTSCVTKTHYFTSCWLRPITSLRFPKEFSINLILLLFFLAVILIMVASFQAEACGNAKDKIICFINKPASSWHVFIFRPYAVNTTAWLVSKWRCVLITRWWRNADILTLYHPADKVTASLAEEAWLGF
jgi:hypothetical protein